MSDPQEACGVCGRCIAATAKHTTPTMSTVDIDKSKEGYIKVQLDYAPKTNGKKFAKWCEEHGFTPLNAGRRAWSSSLSTYLRDASGVAYADGEPFLFYEEDLVDIAELHTTLKAELLAKIEKEVFWVADMDIDCIDKDALTKIVNEL